MDFGTTPVTKNNRAREIGISFFRDKGFEVIAGDKHTPYDFIIKAEPKDIAVILRFGDRICLDFKDLIKIAQTNCLPAIFCINQSGQYFNFVNMELQM